MHDWAAKNGVELRFIQPGKPVQNAYIESFNSRFQDECLSQHWFASLSHMRSVIDNWRDYYNHRRGHSTLGYIPPADSNFGALADVPSRPTSRSSSATLAFSNAMSRRCAAANLWRDATLARTSLRAMREISALRADAMLGTDVRLLTA